MSWAADATTDVRVIAPCPSAVRTSAALAGSRPSSLASETAGPGAPRRGWPTRSCREARQPIAFPVSPRGKLGPTCRRLGDQPWARVLSTSTALDPSPPRSRALRWPRCERAVDACGLGRAGLSRFELASGVLQPHRVMPTRSAPECAPDCADETGWLCARTRSSHALECVTQKQLRINGARHHHHERSAQPSRSPRQRPRRPAARPGARSRSGSCETICGPLATTSPSISSAKSRRTSRCSRSGPATAIHQGAHSKVGPGRHPPEASAESQISPRSARLVMASPATMRWSSTRTSTSFSAALSV